MNITEKCVEAAKNTEKIYQLGRESVLNPNLKYNVVDIKDNNWKYWGQKAIEFEDNIKNMSDTLYILINGLFKPDDTKDVIDFGHMFANCDKLMLFPEPNTSNGEIFDYMFYGCKTMTDAPFFDTSKGKVFRHMFSGCSAELIIPEYDTSNGEDFLGMFYGCEYLQKLPNLNTGKGKNFQQFLDGCWRLKGSYEFDTSNGTNFDYFARNCQQLTGLKINISNATTMKSPFNNCNALTNLEFEGDIPISLNLSNSPKLDYKSSAYNIITKLRDYQNDTANKYKHTITLHPDVWELVDTKFGSAFKFTYKDENGNPDGYIYCNAKTYISKIGWLRA